MIFAGTARPVLAQAAKPLMFDAASVKPISMPAGVTVLSGGSIVAGRGSGTQIRRNTGGPGTDDPGQIHYPFISLKSLLGLALDSYFEIRGPGWLDTQMVAVDATMPPDTTQEQFREMLRNLLTGRFKLKYHAGKEEAAGYALVVVRNGLKMKRPLAGADGCPVPGPQVAGRTGVSVTAMIGSRTCIVGEQATMSEFVDLLKFLLKRAAGPDAPPVPVTDSTGLAARYDFTFAFSAAAPGSAPEPAEFPDVFSALQSQLGLRLDPRKVSVAVMVVDHMEKVPTENQG
jgi:uncharacterized protein (TIGR03435 family)